MGGTGDFLNVFSRLWGGALFLGFSKVLSNRIILQLIFDISTSATPICQRGITGFALRAETPPNSLSFASPGFIKNPT